MTYAAASAYLLGTVNETRSRTDPYRLDRMAALLSALGNPHRAYPTIHVGGTAGKGSTATMIAAALTADDRRTGLHAKPHLVSMTERARIDGVPITEERFGEILGDMRGAIDAVTLEEGRPSYFETLLALAFVDFERAPVDVAVIEVGLGGKLDGTNLIVPEVAAITNVGLDHTEVLGETVELIAADKAGIAKPGVPLVTDAREPARAVIEAEATARGASVVSVGDVTAVLERPGERYGRTFGVQTARGTYEIALPVLGRFQERNAATAIAVLERLPDRLRPSIEAVERGFASVVMAGRMEFVPGYPSIVFDIAHNPDKSASLAEALSETFPDRHFTFVVAISESKDAFGVLAPLLALPSSFVCTTFETAGRTSERPLRLANMVERSGRSARAIGDPIEALGIARRQTSGDDVVVVTGSTFLVGSLREWWLDNVAVGRR